MRERKKNIAFPAFPRLPSHLASEEAQVSCTADKEGQREGRSECRTRDGVSERQRKRWNNFLVIVDMNADASTV
ncbi:hypothetical protein E2C01_080528 [Portunus trituberculatus]|uniref:Uncharacterized protein n=1 Tax=Portunus trituberculatus TaxID=210409 RepID=A0A5B7IMG4_PORTR|nr:hypothetical protein [Portunus trituberculatus]